MSNQLPAPSDSFLSADAAAIPRYAAVKIDGNGDISFADATEDGVAIGYTARQIPIGGRGTVVFYHQPVMARASAAILVGARVDLAADGEVVTDGAAGKYIALTPAAAAHDSLMIVRGMGA